MGSGDGLGEGEGLGEGPGKGLRGSGSKTLDFKTGWSDGPPSKAAKETEAKPLTKMWSVPLNDESTPALLNDSSSDFTESVPRPQLRSPVKITTSSGCRWLPIARMYWRAT